MLRCSAYAFLAAATAFAADRLTTPQLIEMAHHPSAGFEEALRTTLGDDKIKKGTAFAGEGAEFLFAVEAATRPELFVDDQTGAGMQRIGQTSLWFQTATLRPGTVHGFHYEVNGVRTGGSTDVAAYGPDSYPRP